MKRHEWHTLSVAIIGFSLLLAFQNCGKPSGATSEKINDNHSGVRAFMSVKCITQGESTFDVPSKPNFDESIFEKFDVYFNDLDCDSKIDALLINLEIPEIIVRCFNYQDYGFGNCYPDNDTTAELCSKKDSECSFIKGSNQ